MSDNLVKTLLSKCTCWEDHYCLYSQAVDEIRHLQSIIEHALGYWPGCGIATCDKCAAAHNIYRAEFERQTHGE